MNPIILLTLLVTLCAGNLISLSTQCPEQSVPDLNKVCISPDYIEGCQQYKSVSECFKCFDGYDLSSGKCNYLESSATNQGVSGCLVSNGNGQCNNCANGFRRVDGQCKPGVKYCEEYQQDGACKKCNIEYSLIFSECKHNSLLGCKVELSDHTCSECHKPFALENHQCYIKDCKTYNDFGCISCECGFYITDSRSCARMSEGCLKYNRGICVECLPHFKLKGGSCLIEGCQQYKNGLCQSCSSDYELANGVCSFKSCLDWKDETCLICKTGFNLSQGKCQASVGNFVCEG